MTATLDGLAEPDEPDQPPGELTVVVTVPEEFAGLSLQELITRNGRLTGMDVQEQSVAISATLPASQYNSLVEAIRVNLQGRGRVVLAES